MTVLIKGTELGTATLHYGTQPLPSNNASVLSTFQSHKNSSCHHCYCFSLLSFTHSPPSLSCQLEAHNLATFTLRQNWQKLRDSGRRIQKKSLQLAFKVRCEYLSEKQCSDLPTQVHVGNSACRSLEGVSSKVLVGVSR